MKGRPVDQLVYEQMVPKPRPHDLRNFQAIIRQHLIPEVRQEVQAFYGHIDTLEAKYPGLDYCHPTHRVRLSRWPWHRRLINAFDALHLTKHEIHSLTQWEGTRWAKERFERGSGITILETTDDIPAYVEPEDRPPRTAEPSRAPSEESQGTVEDQGDAEPGVESDGELQSVGYALNERLIERAAQNETAGARVAHYESEWEQWLKNAIDSGELPFSSDFYQDSNQDSNQDRSGSAPIPPFLFPPSILDAARAGRWEGIPDWLRGYVRRAIAFERNQRGEQSSETSMVLAQLGDGGFHMGIGNYNDLAMIAADIAADIHAQQAAQPGA
ncbi:hypothetical protein F5Y17DRAFT_80468 [Xylariaceae sp. FL0594]|nr:hypothetical protein F5Y17DRAFT_80468 [Xylariaceae sp. FL0594]